MLWDELYAATVLDVPDSEPLALELGDFARQLQIVHVKKFKVEGTRRDEH